MELSWHFFRTPHLVCNLTSKSNRTDEKVEYYVIQNLWNSEL